MVDRAHDGLSGPATRHILKREFEVYGKAEFERLARISNGQLYNLRRDPRYRERVCRLEKTRPAAVPIGQRRKPDPRRRPGFLRIDTVHQGDGPDGKGLYHINAVDEVAQWEIVQAAPRISEAYLLPVLERMRRSGICHRRSWRSWIRTLAAGLELCFRHGSKRVHAGIEQFATAGIFEWFAKGRKDV